MFPLEMQDGLRIREAVRADLPAIVRMLADDPLGAAREHVTDPLPSAYEEAFAAIEARPDIHLLVAEEAGRVIGCLQLIIMPGLTLMGAKRAEIEGVRVAADARGRRIGERLVEGAIEHARQCGCRLIQLTTNKSRKDAHRFYERLGFEATHIGMKLPLTP